MWIWKSTGSNMTTAVKGKLRSYYTKVVTRIIKPTTWLGFDTRRMFGQSLERAVHNTYCKCCGKTVWMISASYILQLLAVIASVIFTNPHPFCKVSYRDLCGCCCMGYSFLAASISHFASNFTWTLITPFHYLSCQFRIMGEQILKFCFCIGPTNVLHLPSCSVTTTRSVTTEFPTRGTDVLREFTNIVKEA